ncbi:hypothetical protein AVEN_29623-1 [Araneus ventricosus]|uniref:Ig-like domain-containing protein n=1 Tax=Araneus ventricosus TaxID=182803 RepID=A0A4Y2UDH5_ARAVE|nr:hypothetical protein AVEN_270374-1 [Araneus ventricosus]GBO10702.1 hypothetical protein AVEN_29623-1 [Araneus ventricosus]
MESRFPAMRVLWLGREFYKVKHGVTSETLMARMTLATILVTWRQIDDSRKCNPFLDIFIRKENTQDPPWNVVIGSEGRELRISPITESDINENYFTAVAHFQRGAPIRKLHFAIQVMPTDIGVVYPGDTVTIHMPSYVSLPAESMIYKWHLEREPPSLSSNMQASRSGASLMISELRKEQEGILTCRVFTNIGIFATQKRFLIKNVESENSKLIFIATRPPHKFVPLAEWNAKLGQLLESIPKIFGKRDSRTSPNDTDQLDPQRLKHFLSKMPELKKYLTENYNLTIKRKKRSPQPLESLDYFIEPVDSRQTDVNVITDFNLPNEQPQLPFDTRSLNKRQDDYTEEIEDFTPEIEDFEAPMVVESKEYHPNEKDEPETINTPKQGYFGDFDYIEDVRFEQEALDVETPPPQPTQQSKPLSFLEQHRQAILSRLYTSKPRRKQMKKISKTRFRTTTETPEMLDEEGTSLPLQERDIIAMLLSECNRDSQCSLNAECVKRKKSKPGFCRCRPQFEGNGIFCWENDKYKK